MKFSYGRKQSSALLLSLSVTVGLNTCANAANFPDWGLNMVLAPTAVEDVGGELNVVESKANQNASKQADSVMPAGTQESPAGAEKPAELTNDLKNPIGPLDLKLDQSLGSTERKAGERPSELTNDPKNPTGPLGLKIDQPLGSTERKAGERPSELTNDLKNPIGSLGSKHDQFLGSTERKAGGGAQASLNFSDHGELLPAVNQPGIQERKAGAESNIGKTGAVDAMDIPLDNGSVSTSNGGSTEPSEGGRAIVVPRGNFSNAATNSSAGTQAMVIPHSAQGHNQIQGFLPVTQGNQHANVVLNPTAAGLQKSSNSGALFNPAALGKYSSGPSHAGAGSVINTGTPVVSPTHHVLTNDRK